VARVRGASIRRLHGDTFAAWSDSSRGDLRPTGHGPEDGPALGTLALELSRETGGSVERVAWMTQMHGSDVRAVSWESSPVECVGAPAMWHLGEGDAVTSVTPGVALCVLTADCGALALASPEGYFGAVHAGWRGLRDGVVEAAVERLRGWGATDVVGSLGPCIHPGCYEFAEGDLDSVADLYGGQVRGRTTEGRPALDVPAAIAAALVRAGGRMVTGVDSCTACGGASFSHRARADAGRQALVVWSSGRDAGSVAGPDPGA
jgi:copper oxidase (laccase) domain-containing protein